MASKSKGLVTSVRDALRKCVLEAYEDWQTIPPLDLWKIYNRETVTLEQRKETFSIMNLIKKVEERDSFKNLRQVTKQEQPELEGWIATELSGADTQLSSIIVNFMEPLDSTPREAIAESLENLLDEVDKILRTRTVEMVVLAPLKNIMLPQLERPLSLGHKVQLRTLRSSELDVLRNHDVLLSRPPVDSGINLITAALETRFTSQIWFGISDSYDSERLASLKKFQEVLERIDHAHSALHAFAEVKTTIAFKDIRSVSHPLLALGSTRIMESSNAFTGFSSFEALQAPALEEFCINLEQAKRKSILSAISRLRDAELRFSPVDSLVDAIVGLETLLNTEKSGEVALRIPMNFSTLVEPESKFRYFQITRDLYSLRSKIVHGNPNSDSFKIGEVNMTLQEAAQTARQLLRLAIHRFVSDSFFRGEEKLNSRFFEERYFSQSGEFKR